MKPFTSAALLQLVVREFRRQGVLPPVDQAKLRPGRATAPFDDKRGLLESVRAAHGLAPILRVGQGLRAATFDPTVHVLLRAESPFDLLRRWRHLERFYHSHHRVEVLAEDQALLGLRHISLAGGRPGIAENVLIAGLVLALLQIIGCRGVTAAFGAGRSILPFCVDDRIVDGLPAEIAASDRWTLRWRAFLPAAPAAPSIAPAQALPLLVGGARAGHTTRRCEAALARDTSRPWSIQELAAMLGTSRRSLQRRLRGEGATFQYLVREARIREACKLLVSTGFSLGEIGYWCGYTDQAQFSREFRRRANMTPSAYRDLFSGPRRKPPARGERVGGDAGISARRPRPAAPTARRR